ncbi:VanW family protein [Cellulosilyticum ruminicola]|uniref:VanW family protein n=1 Tax=Cellulosilyticum ruminicola TaxID=425254 RepID=UPI0006CF3247|nr:VanW family protein [Cellulosilyticum ruminicola]
MSLGLGITIGTSIEFAKYTGKVFKNISVGDIAIGNKSLTSATDRVKAHYIGDTQKIKLVLQLGETTLAAPLSDFILDTNIDEIMDYVAAYNKELSFIERYNLLTNKTSKTFDISYTYDSSKVAEFVSKFMRKASHPSQNAAIQISAQGEIVRKSDITGLKLDSNALINAVYEQLSPQACFQRSLAATKDTVGTELVIDTSNFATSIPASITSDNLSHLDTLVASYSTSFTPGTGSDVNIAIAAKSINGTLIMPGKTFSYNDIIGNTTLDKGYTYATVIVNSMPTKGVGGGVCQVSSTLYNAILRIGLLPTERRPHSRPSSYVPLGLDATIDWGNIDFKFENTNNYPLYIVSYVKNNKVYVDLYSDKSLLSKTYKFNSEVIKTYPSIAEYQIDSNLPKGTKELISKGSTGYQVRISRETYENGVLSDTTVLYQDTYAPVPTRYKVGA